MGSNPRVEAPYDLSPDHTVLLGVDFQQGFGDGAWEHTPDGLSMAGVKLVILEDACASQPFDGFSAQDAHAITLARFRYQFGQTMTTAELTRIAEARGSAGR